MLSVGTNALASFNCSGIAPAPGRCADDRSAGLIAALHQELPDALRRLQQGAIAPVDLPQAAIGPGMAVFSRYAKVIENDGTTMTVRSALARINEILDQVLNEQEGDFDSATRFAIAWYRQHGYATGKFGVADDLARPQQRRRDAGARWHPYERRRQGHAALAVRTCQRVTTSSPTTASAPGRYCNHLIALLQRDGLPVAGAFMASAQQRPDGAIDTELVKELAFLLFSIAEEEWLDAGCAGVQHGRDGVPDVVQAARSPQAQFGEQGAFDFEED